jgi:hypothetical protein
MVKEIRIIESRTNLSQQQHALSVCNHYFLCVIIEFNYQ